LTTHARATKQNIHHTRVNVTRGCSRIGATPPLLARFSARKQTYLGTSISLGGHSLAKNLCRLAALASRDGSVRAYTASTSWSSGYGG